MRGAKSDAHQKIKKSADLLNEASDTEGFLSPAPAASKTTASNGSPPPSPPSSPNPLSTQNDSTDNFARPQYPIFSQNGARLRTNTAPPATKTKEFDEDLEANFTNNMKYIRKHIRDILELLPKSMPALDKVTNKLDLITKKAEDCKLAHFQLREKVKLVEKESRKRALESEVISSVRDTLSQLATKEDVLAALNSGASANEKLEEIAVNSTNKLETIVSEVKTIREDVAAAASAPSRTTQASPPQRPLYSDVAGRTIVLRPLERNTPGTEVQKVLNAAGVALPVATVEHVRPTRNGVEIICKDSTTMATAKRILQTNQTLNRKCNILQKTTPKHKIIILSVPSHLEKEYIHNTLTTTFSLKENTISILTSLRSKHPNHLNWVVLADEPTALQLVHQNGVTMSHKFCYIRPHTSIPRCLKCQRLGHIAARCTQVAVCSNCCLQHDANTTCTSQPGCINCFLSNRDNKTAFLTDHQASFSSCQAYRTAYRRERARLDRIFGRREVPPRQQHSEQRTPHEDPPIHNKDRQGNQRTVAAVTNPRKSPSPPASTSRRSSTSSV